MAEQKPQRREFEVPIWGLFLLFLGTVLFLQTINVLPWGIWRILWRFWPVLLIAAGTGLLMRRLNQWLTGLVILSMFFSALGIALWQYEPPAPIEQTIKNYAQPLENVQSAQIDVKFTAGNLKIGSLPAESTNIVESDSRVEYRRQNNEGRLYLSRKGDGWPFWDEGRDRWLVELTGKVPFTATVKSDMSTVTLDLGQLHLEGLNIDSDLSAYTVKLPPPQGALSAYIKADLTSITINIPEGAAARLNINADLSAVTVNQNRFPKSGAYFISPGFDSAGHRIELEIDSNLSIVEIP